MSGGPDTSQPAAGDTAALEPLHRALFREAALAHHERWGGDPAAGAGRRGGGSLPAWCWYAIVGATLVCLAVLGLLAVLVRVPVVATVPVLLVRADGVQPGSVVAVFPAGAAGRVRRGTTVQVPAADGAGTLRVGVSGEGPVLTAAQIGTRFPALAGAASLPARGVLAQGAGLPASAGRALGVGDGAVVVTATGQVGDRTLIGLLRSAGGTAGR